MQSNPYFDPNPEWMFITLKIWCVIGTVTSLFGCYMVIFKSPAYKSLLFRQLLIYHIITGTIFQFHLTILSPPLIYLPYVAAECPGIWTAVGVPLDIQISVLITLIIVTVAAIIPLFYYRMDVLIPPHHPLNRKWLRYSLYFIVYGIFHICPIPMLLLAINYFDVNDVKKQFEDSFQITMEGFWRNEVLAVNIPDNPWAKAFLAMVVFAICLAATVSFGCTYVIYTTVKKESQRMSRQMKRDHINMLIALILVMVIITSVAVIIAPFVIYVLITNSPRCDIFNGVITSAGGIFPAFVIAYITSYRPYRIVIIRFFKRQRVHMGRRLTRSTILVLERSTVAY